MPTPYWLTFSTLVQTKRGLRLAFAKLRKRFAWLPECRRMSSRRIVGSRGSLINKATAKLIQA